MTPTTLENLGHKVTAYNHGNHLFINDSVDVWPTTRKYKLRGKKEKAIRYYGDDELLKVINKFKPKVAPQGSKTEAVDLIRRFAKTFGSEPNLSQESRFLIADAITFLESQ